MKPWTAARNGPRRLQIDFRHSEKNPHPAGFSRLRHWFQCVYFMNAVNAAVKSSLQCTWIFQPCRFLDGLRAWNFSTPNLFHPLTQILDPGNFGWFVILPLGDGSNIYTPNWKQSSSHRACPQMPNGSKRIKGWKNISSPMHPNAIFICLNNFRYTEHTPDHNSICLYQLTISDHCICLLADILLPLVPPTAFDWTPWRTPWRLIAVSRLIFSQGGCLQCPAFRASHKTIHTII